MMYIVSELAAPRCSNSFRTLSIRELLLPFRFALHDLGHPNRSQGKFNVAQQFAYTGIILMGAGSVVTGLAIYKPTQIAWLTWLLGGYQVARFEHFCLTIGYILFFLVHIVQVFRAGWNTLRGMITGYEIVATGKVPHDG